MSLATLAFGITLKSSLHSLTQTGWTSIG